MAFKLATAFFGFLALVFWIWALGAFRELPVALNGSSQGCLAQIEPCFSPSPNPYYVLQGTILFAIIFSILTGWLFYRGTKQPKQAKVIDHITEEASQGERVPEQARTPNLTSKLGMELGKHCEFCDRFMPATDAFCPECGKAQD